MAELSLIACIRVAYCHICSEISDVSVVSGGVLLTSSKMRSVPFCFIVPQIKYRVVKVLSVALGHGNYGLGSAGSCENGNEYWCSVNSGGMLS